MEKELTGLALFVYIRPESTKAVIESIKQNGFSKIYVFQDGLKNETDRENWLLVNEQIRAIDFAEVDFIISEENKGLAESIIRGVSYVLERHERVIALEDDIILAKQYREYMESCFDKYAGNKEVMCVAGGDTGHSIPIDYEYDIFFSYRMFSQAWGTWKDRWMLYKRDFSLVREIMQDTEKKQRLMKAGGDILPIVDAQIRGDCNSWAIFWVLTQINEKGVCILPCNELAADRGHDGGGTNSKERSYRFDVTLAENIVKNWRMPDFVTTDDRILDSIQQNVSWPTKLEKFKSYYNLLTQWMESLMHGFRAGDYFQEQAARGVYIYGAGKIAHLLIGQIEPYVKIRGVVVESKSFPEFDGYRVYDITDGLDLSRDTIVVTVPFDMCYIKKLLEEKCNAFSVVDITSVIEER